ncbi:aminotransferase class V-fold PLP-dependent enzyme [bacterium]|nr:aminotransferase class V-fold PLP-dependent enzyme [bacterium]
MNKIIYLDAAASSLKSDAVIDAETDFLRYHYANAGRGICARAAAVDDMVCASRRAVADFINAASEQIVFTSGATDGLNRAQRIICGTLRRDLRVAVSDLDHHSARLPWVAAARRGECSIEILPLDENFNIDVDKIPYADVIVITAMSNVFGVAQDVAAIVRIAREKNPDVVVVVDAAQYVAHGAIDAAAWNADFICFSGHKIGADTGIGIMYVQDPTRWTPDKFGGGMINKIDGDTWVYNAAPECFEAGTLPLTQIAGLKPAIGAWRADAGADVMRWLYDGLRLNPKIQICTAPDAAVLTFLTPGMHVLDFGARVGARGVCMRVGNMCASWAMNLIGAGAGGAARLSAGAWNTVADADKTIEIINQVLDK